MLKYCENKPRFLVDRGPWYNDVFRNLKLSYVHETFGERSKVEAVFSSYKQRSRVYFNKFNLNFREEPKRGDPGTVVEESPTIGKPIRSNLHTILQPTKITLIWTGLFTPQISLLNSD